MVKWTLIVLGALAGAVLVVTQATSFALAWWFGNPYHPFLVVAALRSSSAAAHDLVTVAGVASLGAWFVALGVLQTLLKKAGQGARFATAHELKKRGLLAPRPRRVVLGKMGRQFVCDGGDEHVLVAAPTRAGKGVGLVVPTALCWEGAMLVLDVKGEAFELSSGWRAKMGDRVFVFHPMSRETHRFNPLDALVRSDEPGQEALRLAGAILPLGEQVKDPFWINAGRELLAGALLWSWSTAGERHTAASIGDALDLLLPTPGSDKPVHENMEEQIASVASLHRTGEQYLRAWCEQKDDKTRGNILKTVTSGMSIFQSERVRAATAASDFDLGELRRSLMTVYVVVSPPDMDALSPLLRLVVGAAIAENTRTLPEHDPSVRHQALLLLDEFPLLGRSEVVEKSLGVCAGYGLRQVTIVQSIASLAKAYGERGAEVIVDAHGARVQFGMRRVREAREISEALGREVVRKPKAVEDLKDVARGGGTQESEKLLMSTDEVLNLDDRDALLSMRSMRIAKLRKIRYFEERRLKKRAGRPVRAEPWPRAGAELAAAAE